MASTPKVAQSPVVRQQSEIRERLPFSDGQDFEDARRGLIARKVPGAVTDASGTVVWDNDTYAFLQGEAPDTVNPSLWRQSQLVAEQGLFEVVEGIYQVRGLDLSNITFVEGATGVLVIDPLISTETAAAALALYREHRGERPVTGVLYTHSHVDHFGGVKGVTTQEDVDAGRCPVLAPEGFTEHAVAENVYAGTAMGRRAAYMYGAALARGPQGAVGAGLGQTTSTGIVTLIAPTLTVTRTGQEETVDGIRMVFQMAPNTEAPAELLIHFPDFRALCTAEDATHTLHNMLTLRGAVVRDPHAWSHALTATIDLFGETTDVAFASHHWPTWGQERVTAFLTAQRDLYGYLHDQSLRLINKGWTGIEIAEHLPLPPALENAWSAHGYYGSVSHNLKAVYQRYMGWFDGNPAHLWQHPPVEAGKRYVQFMGGADIVVEKARASFEAGDYRWAAEVLSHVIFADPQHTAARDLLADTFEQLGYGAENGTWRNFYLSGTTELRQGQFGTPTVTASPDVIAHLTPTMLFDAIAIQINGPKAWDEKLTIDVHLTDADERYRLTLSNGVLSYSNAPRKTTADVTLTSTVSALSQLTVTGLTPEGLDRAGVQIQGDASALHRLTAVLDPGDPDFPIVTP
ncbi:alkyl/aryl-sulfatase [Streptomyces sp. NBC_00102]|uniref:alkyl/aryl-sulfatase n=1 Tax=Streptomyces sp. NBC_00102 TaxID=2975652 RepID=UPI00225A7F58|nr:alkyl sulfatase dimerization domain-containing protein [Streptomyces sp. NBC_00102]MCX5401325.1 MBL fold metallo-hydrolase [Streptomyces sp. NBC_00102]